MNVIRTESGRRAAALSPTAAAFVERTAAEVANQPFTDEQIATLRRCLPPVDQGALRTDPKQGS